MTTPRFENAMCAACAYDVSATMRDGIRVCPECGEELRNVVYRTDGASPSRSVGVYLGLCFAGPLLTVSLALLLGEPGLGRVVPWSTVVSVLIAYIGGTLCVLGWPTGAGAVLPRVVKEQRQLASMVVFVALVLAGGTAMMGGAALGWIGSALLLGGIG